MTQDDQLRQLVVQAQQRLQETLHDAEVLVMDLANIHRMLSASDASDKTVATTPTPDLSTRIAIVKGRHVHAEQVRVNGSCSPGDISAWRGVVEAAFRGFTQVLDIALADGDDDDGRRELACVLSPAVRQMLASLEACGRTGPNNMTGSPCDSCTNKQDCKAPCEYLKAGLDSVHKGKLPRETTGGLDFGAIRARRGSPEGQAGDEKARKGDRGIFRDHTPAEPYDALDSYRPCWDRLSHKQQEAVRLYHGEQNGLVEIAAMLSIAPSSTHGRLKRARAIRDDYTKQLRKEEFHLRRELETK